MLNISVVIPTYNRSEAVLKAVQSVLNQTYLPIEIIIVDDGSAKEILMFLHERVVTQSPIIKIIELSHSGHPGRVRNVGVENSSSEWIAFLDSDDTWTPNKLQNQAERITQGEFMALAETHLRRKGFQPRWTSFNTRKLTKRNAIVCSSVLVQKKLLIQAGGFPKTFSSVGVEDYLTWLSISQLSNWQVSSSNDVVYESTSQDRLSVSEDVQNRHQQVVALIQFAEKQQKHNRVRNLTLRMYLKLIRIFI
jgi:teichuronic acid biosynthesis glycosyltransferase TuaG